MFHLSRRPTAGQAPTHSRGMPDRRYSTAAFHRIPFRVRVPVRSTGISPNYPDSSAPPTFLTPNARVYLPVLPSTIASSVTPERV